MCDHPGQGYLTVTFNPAQTHTACYTFPMTETKHRMTWFVYAGSEKIRRTSIMRGTWGYEVTCSCGWETRTGGATKSHIDELIWLHKQGC